ncbi:MAG TPA: lytic transglycosylase domain-containing protein [Vicinamibacterales bacterium]|jgi:soluble lytic murein transglycosylase-like protein
MGKSQIATAFLCLGGLTTAATPARAELVFFANGGTVSVKTHRLDGDSCVLTLRSGGEMTLPASQIDRIAPDEVPYPEPAAETADATATSAVTPASQVPTAYAEIIDRVSKEHGVDPKLVRAVIQVESAYQQTARSRRGAMGLMQLMPTTARQYSVKDPYDPASNIAGGIRYLKDLLDRWPRELALAAYNAGEAAVLKFGGIPPYPETRAYVSRIMQLVGR